MKLQGRKSYEVTVKLIGEVGCPVEINEIEVKINKAGKKCVSVSPKSANTDSSGSAIFTVNAKKSIGRAKVTFKAGSLKESMVVKVK